MSTPIKTKKKDFYIYCTYHPQQKIDYFCLGKGCQYLMICHECTLHDLNHAKMHKNELKQCNFIWELLKENNYLYESNKKINFDTFLEKITERKLIIEKIIDGSYSIIENQLTEIFNEIKKKIKQNVLLEKNKIDKIISYYYETLCYNKYNLIGENTPIKSPLNFLELLNQKYTKNDDKKLVLSKLFERNLENIDINSLERDKILKILDSGIKEWELNISNSKIIEELQLELSKRVIEIESLFNLENYFEDVHFSDFDPIDNAVPIVKSPLKSDFFHINKDYNNKQDYSLDVFGKVTQFQTIDCNHVSIDKNKEGTIISQVQCLFFEDSYKIFTCSKDKTLKIYDTATNQTEKTLIGHIDWVYRFLINEEKGKLITAGIDKNLKLWNLKKGLICENTIICESPILTIYGHEDNNFFTIGMRSQGIKIIDFEFNLIGNLKFGQDQEVWSINSIKFENVILLVLGLVDGTISTIKYVESNRSLNFFSNQKKCHSSIIFDIIKKENNQILTCSGDCTIKLWNYNYTLIDFKLINIKSIKAHNGFIRKILSFKENIIVSCSDDASLKFWEGDTLRNIQTIKKAHANAVYWIEKINNDILLTCGEDNCSFVKLWH